MTVSCNDREHIFLDGTAEEWLALEAHAASCPECAKEVHGWKELSVAAAELRDYRENTALWPKIETLLVEQSRSKRGPAAWLEQIFRRRAHPEDLATWIGRSLGTDDGIRGRVSICKS